MSAPSLVRIGSSGLKLHEDLLLMSTIRVCSADHPQLRFEFVSDQTCDVQITTEQAARPVTTTAPKRVRVLRSGDATCEGLTLHFPLRVAAIQALLRQLATWWLEAKAGTAVQSSRPPHALQPVAAAVMLKANPRTADTFIEKLHRQLQQNVEVLELLIPGQSPTLVIECWRKKYFLPTETAGSVSGEGWMELLGKLTEHWEIRPAAAAKAAHSRCEAPRRALDRLLWRLGMLAPELCRWLPEHGRFQLRRWPDFGALGTQARFIKLAALLVRQTLTLDELVQNGHMQRSEVIQFLNGCELCGLLKVSSTSTAVVPLVRPAPRQAPASSAGMRGLLGRIRSALHLG